MRPKSYAVQDGCHNCKNVFSKIICDDAPELYCTFESKNKPISGTPFVDCERFDHSNERKMLRQMNAWDKWRNGREVTECGKCDKWEGCEK